MKIIARTIAIIILIINFIYAFISYYPILGFRIFVVASGSMEPTINTKNVILVKRQDSYKKNDIITRNEEGIYITHRIVDINDDYIITKGDNNDSNDEISGIKDVVGKVILTTSSKIVLLFKIISIIIVVALLMI